MVTIKLTKVQDPSASRWLRAVSTDYDVPRNAQVFWGWGPNDDRIAVWVGEDGRAFGAIDGDPAGYVKSSKAMSEERWDDATHPGVDEIEFRSGTFDPRAESLEIETRSSLY